MAKLRVKQAAFVKEYLKDLNATQAAKRAGYRGNDATLCSIGNENLRKPLIAKMIQQEMDQRARQVGIDAEYVLKRLVEIDQLDVIDIFNQDLTGIKPLNEWPKAWRTTIQHIEVSELFEYIDGSKEPTGLLKKIKMPDKVKNLELIGKHTAVRCWDKDLNINSDGIEMHLHYS